jgi:hypothetical protein
MSAELGAVMANVAAEEDDDYVPAHFVFGFFSFRGGVSAWLCLRAENVYG